MNIKTRTGITPKKIGTPKTVEEKLEKMYKKNPKIKDLFTTFGLELTL